MQRNTDHLYKTLNSSLPAHEFKNICQYLFCHPGKLFRSQLIAHLSEDLSLSLNQKHDTKLLEAFVEIHHTYTLIHDDLPAMDDDDIRRGKQATHIKFGEANAILAGDALLISSFEALSNIQSANLAKILKLTTWACGAKGLINGQFLDLKATKKNFEQILRIHELKTSRLFQICSLGTLLINENNENFDSKRFKDFMRIGSYIGILFQLLDDYKDRNEKGAEFNNLFSLDSKRSLSEIKKYSEKLNHLFDCYQLKRTALQISSYTKSVDDLILFEK